MSPGQHVSTVTLFGRPLRIYASPRSGPDHPFASFGDLAAIAEVDPEEWAAKLRHDVPDELYTLPDGTVLISEPLVGGMFQAWVWMGAEAAQAMLDQWHDAWTEAFAMLHSHLPRKEWRRVADEAALRNIPKVPDTVVQ